MATMMTVSRIRLAALALLIGVLAPAQAAHAGNTGPLLAATLKVTPAQFEERFNRLSPGPDTRIHLVPGPDRDGKATLHAQAGEHVTLDATLARESGELIRITASGNARGNRQADAEIKGLASIMLAAATIGTEPERIRRSIPDQPGVESYQQGWAALSMRRLDDRSLVVSAQNEITFGISAQQYVERFNSMMAKYDTGYALDATKLQPSEFGYEIKGRFDTSTSVVVTVSKFSGEVLHVLVDGDGNLAPMRYREMLGIATTALAASTPGMSSEALFSDIKHMQPGEDLPILVSGRSRFTGASLDTGVQFSAKPMW